MKTKVNKSDIQNELVEILSGNLANLRAMSDNINSRAFLKSDTDELAIMTYLKSLDQLTQLIGTSQNLINSIPEEIISNEFTEMSDQRLLQIINQGNYNESYR